MNRKGHILIVEDLPDWREVFTEILEKAGYQVCCVATIKDAWQALDEYFFHLILLDIRMEDNDPSNEEGMAFLREIGRRKLHQTTKIIIESAYGTKKQMREAFSQYRVADYIQKEDFEEDEFLEIVTKVFQDQLKINLNLQILWKQNGENYLKNMLVKGERVKMGTSFQIRLFAEVEDLLCRLFHDARKIVVRPREPGLSGARVLEVRPFYEHGGGTRVIVKFGDLTQIEEEFQNFNKYVKRFVDGANTMVLERRRTPLLEGIVYSYLSTGGKQMKSLGAFYQSSSSREVNAVLNHLFTKTCGPWFNNMGPSEPLELMDLYWTNMGRPFSQIHEAFGKSLKSVHGKELLVFSGLPGNDKFTNPILEMEYLKIIEPTHICITHGDLNPDNVLIDSHGETWLIDFQATGPGHYLRDFAELDTAIRIQLLTEKEACPEERFMMEKVLCSAEGFNDLDGLADKLSSANEALTKAFVTTIHLRKLAFEVKHLPEDYLTGYYAAVFCYSLNMIRFRNISKVQREHALLSASLILDRLKAMDVL